MNRESSRNLAILQATATGFAMFVAVSLLVLVVVATIKWPPLLIVMFFLALTWFILYRAFFKSNLNKPEPERPQTAKEEY